MLPGTLYSEDREYTGAMPPDVELAVTPTRCGYKIQVSAKTTPLRFLRLTWRKSFAPQTRFLGDAWERTYGDSQWRTMDSGRAMPWYFLARDGECTEGFGVKVRPGAFALWYATPQTVTLWLDLRCGTRGVLLNGRTLDVAEVIVQEFHDCSAFEAGCRFCQLLCDDPILSPTPVYGINDWYYSYSRSTAETILADSAVLGRQTADLKNRPFSVVDGGWTQGESGSCNRPNSRFQDMAALASGIRERGCRPGIWFRPLHNRNEKIQDSWRSSRDPGFLDPSVPEVLALVQNNIRLFAQWGYELIKHDFSTNDSFGCWGFEMHPWPASGKWRFSDQGRTSAEIITALYRAIHEADHRMLILGCNTIGHLGAGLMHLARIGDDTSGRSWERTRRMGVNTLAFRMMQHKAFFDIDADCAGVTEQIPWKMNRQWLRLLSESGTPLFASILPNLLDAAQQEELKRYWAAASEQRQIAVPLDWEQDTCPSRWLLNGKEVEFDWYDDQADEQDFIDPKVPVWSK